MKTKEEIAELENSWVKDPCWDIEKTEGFGKVKKELLIFKLKKELEWANQRLKKFEEIKESLREFLGINEICERLSLLDEQ